MVMAATGGGSAAGAQLMSLQMRIPLFSSFFGSGMVVDVFACDGTHLSTVYESFDDSWVNAFSFSNRYRIVDAASGAQIGNTDGSRLGDGQISVFDNAGTQVGMGTWDWHFGGSLAGNSVRVTQWSPGPATSSPARAETMLALMSIGFLRAIGGKDSKGSMDACSGFVIVGVPMLALFQLCFTGMLVASMRRKLAAAALSLLLYPGLALLFSFMLLLLAFMLVYAPLFYACRACGLMRGGGSVLDPLAAGMGAVGAAFSWLSRRGGGGSRTLRRFTQRQGRRRGQRGGGAAGSGGRDDDDDSDSPPPAARWQRDEETQEWARAGAGEVEKQHQLPRTGSSGGAGGGASADPSASVELTPVGVGAGPRSSSSGGVTDTGRRPSAAAASATLPPIAGSAAGASAALFPSVSTPASGACNQVSAGPSPGSATSLPRPMTAATAEWAAFPDSAGQAAPSADDLLQLGQDGSATAAVLGATPASPPPAVVPTAAAQVPMGL
jgi:hypothetical protein